MTQLGSVEVVLVHISECSALVSPANVVGDQIWTEIATAV